MKKFLLFMVLLCYATAVTWGQDGCAAAVALTPGTQQCGNSAGLAGDFPNAGGAPANPCSANYNDDEYWFSYTAAVNDERLDLTMSAITMTWAGLFVIDSCAGGTTACVESDVNFGSTLDISFVTPGLIAGNTYYIVISNYGTPNNTSFCLDAAVLPPITCPDPSSLDAINIGSSTADITWIENGSATSWKVEYGPDGFTPGTGTMQLASDTFSNLTGLMSNTDYEAYVTAICGVADSSLQIGPTAFTTECAVLAPPYTTDFTSFVPDCWIEANTGDPSTGPMTLGSGSWTSDGFGNVGTSGSARIEIYSNFLSDWILSPEFDLTGGPFQADFDIAMTIWNNTNPGKMGQDDTVQLLITVDAGTTWTPLMTWDSSSVVSTTGENIVVDLSAYSGMTAQFGFWATDGAVDDIEDINFYVDNFFVRTPPSCFEPSALGSTNITGTTATVFWTANNAANNWKVEYDTAGFTQGSGTMILATDTFLNLTGLMDNTSHDFYVQEICGPGDSSFVVGPASFTTIAANPPSSCGTVITPADGDIVDNIMPLSFTVPADADNVWLIAGQDPDPANRDTFTFAQADTINLIYSILALDSTYYITTVPTNSAGAAMGCRTLTVTVKPPPPSESGAMCASGGLNPFYIESFADTLPGGWGGSIGTGATANLWNVNSGGTVSGGTGPTAAHAGSHYLYFESSTPSDTASVVSAPYDLSGTADAVELEFFVHMHGVNGNVREMGNMLIEASSDSMNWTGLDTLTGLYNVIQTSDWFPARYDLSAFAGQSTVYIRWTAQKFNVNGFRSDMAIDEVVIKTCVACAEPSDGVATNLTSVGADLDWTENGGATSWHIEIDTAGFTPGTGAFTTTVSSLPYTWTGGVPTTDYEYYVASICGGGMVSDTAGPYAFTTGCAVLTPDYYEDFSTYIPLCWTQIDNTAGGEWAQDDYRNDLTDPNGKAATINIYDLENDSLFSPEFDLSSGMPYGVEFDVAMVEWNTSDPSTFGADDKIDLLITDDGGATWTVLMTYDTMNTPSDLGQHEVILLTGYTGTVQFCFHADAGAVNQLNDNDFFVDNFRIRVPPACPEPTAFTASNESFTTADLDWTAGGTETDWVVSYGPVPTAAGAGMLMATMADSLNLTGLSPDTDYDAHLRAVCGGDSSPWISLTFSTIGLPPANDTCGGAISLMCGDSLGGQSTEFATGGVGTSCNGSRGDDVWFQFTGTGDEVTVSVDADVSGGFAAQVDVHASSDGSCGTLSCVSGAGGSGGGLNPVSATFISVPGTEYYIAVGHWINGNPGGDFGIKIDCNDCYAHSGVSVSNETANSAQVSWISAPGSTGFTVEFGPDGFSQGTGTVISSGTAGGPINMTGLMSNTDYDVYVAETCGGMTDTIGPVSFATACEVFVPYYLDSFNTFVQDCWNEADAGTIATGPMSLGFGSWIADDFGNVVGGPNGRSARINAFVTHADWILSPMFDLSAGGHLLIFDVAATEFGSTALPAVWPSTDTMHCLISEDGGSTWTSLMEWNQSSFPSLAGDSITIDIGAVVSPTTQFAFYYTTGGVDSPEDIDVFVDQFEITSPSPCAAFLFINGTPAASTYRAEDIVSDALIGAPGPVIFQAGNAIDLNGTGANGGFEVQLGVEFDAQVVDCP